MNELRNLLNERYDPSDTDKAQWVAYLVLDLLSQVDKACKNDDDNRLMGKDDKIKLRVTSDKIANQLGLIEYLGEDTQVQDFAQKLSKSWKL